MSAWSRSDIVDAYPLSRMQSGIYYHYSTQQGETLYHDVFSIHIASRFDAAAFRHSIAQVIAAHPVLRTSFDFSRFSQPMQLVHKEGEVRYRYLAPASADIEALIGEEIARLERSPFDLEQKSLLRFTVIRRNDTEYQLLVDAHHMILDGWSMALLLTELFRNYLTAMGLLPAQAAARRPATSFKDFVRAELKEIGSGAAARFWSEYLAQHEYRPFAFQPEAKDQRVRTLKLSLAEHVHGLQHLARVEKVMLRDVLLAAHLRVCAFVEGSSVASTTVVANGRLEAAGGDEVLGLFLNSVPLRVPLARQTWRQLIQAVKGELQAVLPQRRYPFAEMAKQHGSAVSDISFNFVHFFVYRELQGVPGFQIIDGGILEKNNFKLAATFHQGVSGNLELLLSYDEAAVGADGASRIAAYYAAALRLMLAEPDSCHAAAALLPAAERALLPAQSPAESDVLDCGSIHGLFERQAAQQPDRTALQMGRATLSYQALNMRANQLAHHLRTLGVGPDVIVGVCMERSLEMIVAMLAVLKAGGAYLPLNPQLPVLRLRYMIDDSAAKIVITHELPPHLAQPLSEQVLAVDAAAHELFERCPDHDPPPPAGRAERHLAYVIYTSGSTGKPKGVMIEHRGVVRFVIEPGFVTLDRNSVVLQLSSASFDLSVFEIWGALLNGGKLVLYPQPEIDFALLNALIIEHRINVMWFMARLFDSWSQDLPALEHRLEAVVGGEVVNPQAVAHVYRTLPTISLVNGYGPTENTILSCCYRIPRDMDEQRSVPVGWPVNHTRVCVLSREGRPVPPGAVGLLHVAGVGLARGYVGLPELTRARFIANPFNGDPADRFYNTGDLARLLPDGNVEFIGRIDNQVKIRGFRIELGEIEHCLASLEEVESCVVRLHERQGGQKQLVAYLIVHEAYRGDWSACRGSLERKLRDSLPDYMIPSLFIQLEQWPLSANGKADLARLPVPQGDAADAAHVVPASALERTLVEIWADLLRLPASTLSVAANFFELGGDSILSVNLVSRAAKQGLHFSVKDLFLAKNIRQLAGRVTLAARVTAPQGAVAGDLPLLPIQRAFFTDQNALDHFNQAVMLSAPAELDAAALRAVVGQLYQRHDALRLAFSAAGHGTARHLPLTAALLENAVESVDWPDASFAGIEDYATRVQGSLRIAQGVLFKAVLFRPSAEPGARGRLLLVIHHLVVDGVSWRILLEDIERLYGQWRAGQPLSLPAKTSSYQQWARFLVDYAQSAALAAERDYWLAAPQQPAVNLSDAWRGLDRGEAGQGRLRAVLDNVRTGQLLSRCNRAHGTEINELLLAALLLGAYRASGCRAIRLDLEGHGREELSADLDVTQTLGWFTSVHPLTLQLGEDESIAAAICAVKDSYRGVPRHGIGYGILKYLCGVQQLQAQAPAELAFNYLGQFDQVFDARSHFSAAPEPVGQSVSPARVPTHPLSLLGMARDGQLSLELVFDRSRYGHDSMRRFVASVARSLEDVVDHCMAVQRGRYTPADFPLARAAPAELEHWCAAAAGAAAAQVEDLYPATGMQQGLLFHGEWVKGSYVTQLSIVFDGLHIQHFQQAWSEVIRRHGILRTVFVGLDSKQAHQLVLDEWRPQWHARDLRALPPAQQQEVASACLQADKEQGFAAAAPLMRLSLLQLSDAQTQFVWSHHHALLDGWSVALILGEVTECYRALVAAETAQLAQAVTYRSYAAWLQKQDTSAAKAFWRDRLLDLEGATPLPLAAVTVDRSRRHTKVSESIIDFSAEQTRHLTKLAQLSNTTLSVVLQAGWALLLARYSGRKQVVFGTVVSGRPAQLDGVERIAGLFINTIPVIADIEAHVTVCDWLRSLHRRHVESDEYSYLPLAEIQQSASHPRALFDSLVVFENYPIDAAIAQRLLQAGLSASGLQVSSETSYGITLTASIDAALSIRTGTYQGIMPDGQEEQVYRHLKQLLLQLADSPQARLGEIEMLSVQETQRALLELERREEYPRGGLIHQLFETQAQRCPERVAALCEERQITYGELNARANQLAHELSARGAGPDVLVGLYLERSLDLLVGMLAILKAGSAYLPLAPDHPAARVCQIVADAALSIVVTERHLLERLSSGLQHVVCLDDPDSRRSLSARSAQNPRVSQLTERNLAYVIYTSGSTGQPKGVMIEHRNVMRLFQSTAEFFNFDEHDCWVMAHSFAFDFSVWELWGALIHGGKVVVAPQEVVRDAARFSALLERHAVTVLNQTPAAFYSLMRQVLSHPYRHRLRYVIFGGEALSFQRLQPWFESDRYHGTRLINMYGITEITVHATVHEVTAADVAGSVIGRPLGDMSALICNEALQPQPAGVVGELLLAGGGLARGYLNRPELTAERFFHMPRAPGIRFYRTGDLVKSLPDGSLVYIGRNDSQVKIRGFRIELGEIRNRLEKSPLVSAALVEVYGDGEDKRLVAYVVPAAGPARCDLLDAIKLWLASELPAYMVPANLMLLESLPLNANGKVDRSALPSPAAGAARGPSTPPVTESQVRLCELWQKILERQQVGIDDNFFEIGGHSLLAARVNAQLKQQFGLEVGFDELFRRPTVRALAGFIDDELRLESALSGRQAARASNEEQGEVLEI